jgi:hypothetical protein
MPVRLAVLAILFSVPQSAPTRAAQHPIVAPAKVEREAPEAVVRAFMFALYANDSVAFEKRIVPEPGSGVLIGRQKFTGAQLKALQEEVDAVPLDRVSPFTREGRPVVRQGQGSYPDGSKTMYATEFRGVNLAIPVVRLGGEWKVDVRFWLQMRRQAESTSEESDPDVRAKEFLYYILSKDPDKLNEISARVIDGKQYTKANDLRPGDLDQILSLCVEMPVVRARTGEGFLMPSGEIVRAGTQSDTLVLVGLMATVEVPFVVTRVGTQWKVVPQKYFEMLRAAKGV